MLILFVWPFCLPLITFIVFNCFLVFLLNNILYINHYHNEGVHLISNGGFVSDSHEEADIEQTTIAFDVALTAVVGEGYLAG